MTTRLIESRIDLPEVGLSLFEWPGSGPATLFIHATGFHARCWDQVIAGLPGQFCLAVDMPGHGRSDKPPPPYRWRWFGEVVAALVATRDLWGAVLVGHSMGGYAAALAAALVPDRVAGLLLIDPVIFPPQRYGALWVQGSFAARRRNHWESPAAMVERFRDREPFNQWDSRVLHDYCRYGLLPDPGGPGFVLACPPEIEAAIYIYCSAPESRIEQDLAALPTPAWVLRSARPHLGASPDMSASPTDPDLAARLPFGRDLPLQAYSHFIPMENPLLIATYVTQLHAALVAR